MPPTQDRLLSTTLAMRAAIEKDFYSTQRVLEYPVYKNVMARGKEMTQAEIERKWQIRVLDAGASSVTEYQAFSSASGRRVDVVAQMSVKQKFWKSHENCLYDEIVMDGFNSRSSEGFQYSLKDGDEDAAFEAFVSEMDRAFLDVPVTVDSGGLDGMLGAAYWAGRSQTSGGVFVSQPTPARNGIYTTLRNGDVTGTIGGLDRTTARNARAQTNVATYDGTVNQTLLETVARMLQRMNYRYLAELKGKQGNNTQGPNFCIYMELDKANAYRDFLNTLGGDRRSDYWVVNGMEMDSRMICGTENMPSGLASIDAMLFVNHSNFQFNPVANKYGLQRKHPVGPWSYVVPRVYSGQCRCRTPHDAVGIVHGSW